MKSCLLKLMQLPFYISAVTIAAIPAWAAPEAHGEHYNAHAEAESLTHDDAYKAAHGEVDGLPQLDFTTYTPQIFWMFVIFGLLYFFVAKKTLPEISSTIEGRKNHIQSDLETAEKLSAEADSVHDAYKESLTASQGKASETLQKADEKIKKEATKKSDEFRLKAEEAINETEARIEEAKAQAMADMNDVVAEVAATAVEKITGAQADTKHMQKIINNKAKAA